MCGTFGIVSTRRWSRWIPGNILIFSCGLLTGTAAPSSSRLHINALTPLTGLMGSSSVGGGVGGALRSCGIQSLIMTGRASRPVYLEIDEDSVTVRDARALWGMDTWETAAHFEAGGGPKGALLTIGPGGENGVRFGCIMSGRITPQAARAWVRSWARNT